MNHCFQYNKLSEKFTHLSKNAHAIATLKTQLDHVKLELDEVGQESNEFKKQHDENLVTNLQCLQMKANKVSRKLCGNQN
jgi:hypothetical protein